MIVNNFIKMLLSNKFKEFIKLIKILKIEFSNNKFSNNKFNNNNKNNKNLVINYYKKANKKEISFKIKKIK